MIRTPFEMLHRVGHPEWAGPFDPDSDPLWRAMQIGEMTERDYWDRRATEVFPGVDDPVASLMDTLFAPPRDDVIRPETMMLIEEVPRPAVLTNDLARFHSPAWLDEMGLGTSFDPLIDLSYTGRLKPHPLAYAHAVERLDADPGQVVFADDQPANVAAGIAFGLHAVWFDVTDPRGSVERIRLALG